MSRMNEDFLDAMSCLSFAIGWVNYQENLKQSDNDDIMNELDKKTNHLIERIEQDLEMQNDMLRTIMKKLEV